MLIYSNAYGNPVGEETRRSVTMANANVDQKVTEAAVSKPVKKDTPVKPGSAWRPQPSVLKGSRYKIGNGEEDFVD